MIIKLCLDGLVRPFIIDQSLKGPFGLNRLRAILAMLIALSLTLVPITSAWAATQMRESMQSTDAAAATEDAMSDCMKAMQAQQRAQQDQAQEHNCPCCDTPAKGACPDVGACLAKCSVHLIAVLEPAGVFRPPIIRHHRPADPQKPPEWSRAPPAPPPRA